MKDTYLFLFTAAIFYSINTFANVTTLPTVSTDVHVLHVSSPDQCPRSWNGSGGAGDITDLSGYGIDSMSAVGVASCTGCHFDQQSSDCVCKTCYTYLN
jgi:hypothetical protein